MKRFTAIVVISVLILTMSVGSAYAAICAGMICSPHDVARPVEMAGCGDMEPVDTVLHDACGHESEQESSEAVALQPAMSAAVAAEGLPVSDLLMPSSVEHRTIRSDARGAPHLTAVIRI